MGVLSNLMDWLRAERIEQRATLASEFEVPAAEILARFQASRTIPWRSPTTAQAMGVPAIWRAVNLIANTTATLSFRGYQNGAEMAEADRPRLIVRPNPLTTPRDFLHDTAYPMARYGEAWWWVAKRDFDGLALSLVPVPPREVVVSENPADLRFPIIEWRGRRMRNDDMRQIVLSRDTGDLRGQGPLQVCGAAVSVAVEAQEWAANFFASGGHPSILIKSAIELGEDPATGESEAERLRDEWMSKPNNVPRITDPRIESVDEIGANEQGAQMLQGRGFQVGEVARMFGIPASLLDHNEPGASLTYQNLEGEFTKFLRACLLPDYLEAIEQTLSDLLSRSTVARFNVDSILRADVKTRYEVYKSGIESGVLDVPTAQKMEGLAPGDVELAPVPFSPPQAFPDLLPIQGRSADGAGPWRCSKCGKKLAEVEGYGTTARCRCGTLNTAAAFPLQERSVPAPAGTTFADGAIRVNVAPSPAPSMTIADGAVRGAPVELHVHEGAFRGGDVAILPSATPEPAAVTFRTIIERDPDTNRIIGLRDVPVDAEPAAAPDAEPDGAPLEDAPVEEPA